MLIAALVAAYLFPWEHLPFSAHLIGLLLCIAYSFPLFFAGSVFAEAFRVSPQKSGTFGANILGAVAGGLAQNVSFVLGVKMLLLAAVVCYCYAGIFGRLDKHGWARVQVE